MLHPPLPALPGSYLLVLRLSKQRPIRVGALGVVTFPPGLYVYSGSAMGPGGLRARLGRHWRGGSRRRWHVDYLREQAPVAAAAFVTGRERAECRWAALLAGLGGAMVCAGFGASDCRCPAHLVHLQDDDVHALREALVTAGLRRLCWIDAEARHGPG